MQLDLPTGSSAASPGMISGLRIADPCGAFCAVLTIVLILYAEYVTVFIVIVPTYGVVSCHAFLYTLSAITTLISHFRAQFADPGYIPRHYIPKNVPEATVYEGPRTLGALPVAKKVPALAVCRRCKTVKPKGVHHCSICARCIAKMDHHCPWVNNCVAAFNQKYFLLFLVWTAVLCIYSAAVICSGIYSCAQDSMQCADFDPGSIILIMLNLFESILFGCFVAIMLWDQISAIFENTPYIDKLQGVKNVTGLSRMALLKEVFGERFSWRWFFPLSPPRKVKDDFYRECESYCRGEISYINHELSDDDL